MGRTAQSFGSRMAASLTPAQRTLKARLGALSLHARRDPRPAMEVARAVFAARFERGVDPEGVLDPVERARRADAARRAYFTRLALRSATLRRNKANRRESSAAVRGDRDAARSD